VKESPSLSLLPALWLVVVPSFLLLAAAEEPPDLLEKVGVLVDPPVVRRFDRGERKDDKK